MDSGTGELYDSVEAARAAGVKDELIVALAGDPVAILNVSKAVRAQARKRAKAARKSRKKNR